MIYALAAALIVQSGLFAWLLDRAQARADRERQTLLQRIQAPEVAVAQHAAEHAAPDEPHPLSDDELVDEEAREMIERMERLEAEAAPWLR